MAMSLSSIKKNSVDRAPVTCFHGGPGIGKTTIAASAPDAVVIRTEDGLGALSVDAFPIAETYEDVKQAIDLLLNEKHGYKTLVIDSLSALEPMIWDDVARNNKKANIEEFGFGKGYILAYKEWVDLFKKITLLSQNGIMPILIAHSAIVKFKSPDNDPYDRYQIKLHERAFHVIYERSDIIGFASLKTNVIKRDSGFGKEDVRAISNGDRLLHLVEKPAFIAKNRYRMPDYVNLDWDSFSNALTKGIQEIGNG